MLRQKPMQAPIQIRPLQTRTSTRSGAERSDVRFVLGAEIVYRSVEENVVRVGHAEVQPAVSARLYWRLSSWCNGAGEGALKLRKAIHGAKGQLTSSSCVQRRFAGTPMLAT